MKKLLLMLLALGVTFTSSVNAAETRQLGQMRIQDIDPGASNCAWDRLVKRMATEHEGAGHEPAKSGVAQDGKG